MDELLSNTIHHNIFFKYFYTDPKTCKLSKYFNQDL